MILRASGTSGKLLDAALEYQERGWSLIPTRGKRPAIQRWKPFQTSRADERTLREWFGSGEPDGLAVIMGKVSGGLTCRDFDVAQRYNGWAEAHRDLARVLPTVQTARGFHVYCRTTGERTRKLVDGELKVNGYCLLPPSRHPSGRIYQWIVPLPRQPLPLIGLQEAGWGACDTDSAEDTEGAADTSTLRTTDAIEAAILRTLPQRVGERNAKVFEFARELKALPPLADAHPRDLKRYVRQWHKAALPVIGTKPFEETWIDFSRAWPKVKYPAGSGPLWDIFGKAEAAPVPPGASEYEQPQLRLLISICRELQRVAKDRPFFLSCRTAGRLLGVDHHTAWRWLFLLVQDGVLDLVSVGQLSTGKASEYRYMRK